MPPLRGWRTVYGGGFYKDVAPNGAWFDRQNLGPSLYHLLQVLGKERVMARIEKALATMS